jgi:glutathione S-transferase
VLAESDAIIEYVIAKHGGGHLAVTADSPDYADYLYWVHFANASMMPGTIRHYYRNGRRSGGE